MKRYRLGSFSIVLSHWSIQSNREVTRRHGAISSSTKEEKCTNGCVCAFISSFYFSIDGFELQLLEKNVSFSLCYISIARIDEGEKQLPAEMYWTRRMRSTQREKERELNTSVGRNQSITFFRTWHCHSFDWSMEVRKKSLPVSDRNQLTLFIMMMMFE